MAIRDKSLPIALRIIFHKPTLDVSGAHADNDARRHLIRGGPEIDEDIQ